MGTEIHRNIPEGEVHYRTIAAILKCEEPFDGLEVRLKRAPLPVPKGYSSGEEVIDLDTGERIFGYDYNVVLGPRRAEETSELPEQTTIANMDFSFDDTKAFEREVRHEFANILARLHVLYPVASISVHVFKDPETNVTNAISEFGGRADEPIAYLSITTQPSRRAYRACVLQIVDSAQ